MSKSVQPPEIGSICALSRGDDDGERHRNLYRLLVGRCLGAD